MENISIAKCMTVAGVRIYGTTHAASFVTDPVRAAKYADIRFQFVIPATGTPNGVWTLEASEDPRVEDDIARGTTNAKWVTIAISAEKTSGSTGLTINSADLTTTGATVMECVVKTPSPYSYLRWRWTKSSGTITGGYLFRSGRGY